MGQLITSRKSFNKDLTVILRRSGMPSGNLFGEPGAIVSVVSHVFPRDVEDAEIIINEINRQRWEAAEAMKRLLELSRAYQVGENLPLWEIIKKVEQEAQSVLNMLGES